MATVPVGLNVWSRLVEATFLYFDQTVAPFDSIWLPDHVQYDGHKVAEGWTLFVWALARYPDKRCGHEVLCNRPCRADARSSWNYGFRDHALYAHKQDVLKAHCRDVGRDYDEIAQVIRVGILIAETEREVLPAL